MSMGTSLRIKKITTNITNNRSIKKAHLLRSYVSYIPHYNHSY